MLPTLSSGVKLLVERVVGSLFVELDAFSFNCDIDANDLTLNAGRLAGAATSTV